MKSLISLSVALVAFSAIGVLAAPPFDNGFSSGDLRDYVEGEFEPGQIRIAPLDGVNSLFIADGQAQFKTVPVTPDTKYTLSFDGSFTGAGESIEENPRFAVFAQPGQRSLALPSREIQFLDASGTICGRKLVNSMPFREQHAYADAFHTPTDAAALRLNVASGVGVTLAIQNLKLAKTTDTGAININPTLELGPLNYSGWRSISAGGKLIQVNGKTVFDTKYGSRGMAFPLPGPGTYALSAAATSNGYNCCVILDVFDAQGEKLMKSVLRRFGETNYFVPPQEAVSASLLVYSCLLEEVRVVRVGDAAAIGSFLQK